MGPRALPLINPLPFPAASGRFEGADEAWQIIRNGPEPLTSQFSVSYGLVLNLLSVNTLEQVGRPRSGAAITPGRRAHPGPSRGQEEQLR